MNPPSPLYIELVGGPGCGKRISNIAHDVDGTAYPHLGSHYFYRRTEEKTKDGACTRFLYIGRSRQIEATAP